MKIRTEKVIEVDDWDQTVQEAYGRPYKLQQQDGCRDRGIIQITAPNDEAEDFERHTVPEVVNGEERGVAFQAWLSRDPKQKIPGQRHEWELDLWWSRNFYPTLQVIANDLHKKGILESGKYLINIDW